MQDLVCPARHCASCACCKPVQAGMLRAQHGAGSDVSAETPYARCMSHGEGAACEEDQGCVHMLSSLSEAEQAEIAAGCLLYMKAVALDTLQQADLTRASRRVNGAPPLLPLGHMLHLVSSSSGGDCIAGPHVDDTALFGAKQVSGAGHRGLLCAPCVRCGRQGLRFRPCLHGRFQVAAAVWVWLLRHELCPCSAPGKGAAASELLMAGSVMLCPRRPGRAAQQPLCVSDCCLGAVYLSSKICHNCGTTNTPLWRKYQGLDMCNACGVSPRLHMPLCAAHAGQVSTCACHTVVHCLGRHSCVSCGHGRC